MYQHSNRTTQRPREGKHPKVARPNDIVVCLKQEIARIRRAQAFLKRKLVDAVSGQRKQIEKQIQCLIERLRELQEKVRTWSNSPQTG